MVALAPALEDLPICPVRPAPLLLDHLDADRELVQSDRMPAADARSDELVDAALLSDHKMRAHTGRLAEVRSVGCERVPDRAVTRGVGEVEDDRPTVAKSPCALAIVA